MTNAIDLRDLTSKALFDLHEAIHTEMDRREEAEGKVKQINKLLKALMEDLETNDAVDIMNSETGEIIDILNHVTYLAPEFRIRWGK